MSVFKGSTEVGTVKTVILKHSTMVGDGKMVILEPSTTVDDGKMTVLRVKTTVFRGKWPFLPFPPRLTTENGHLHPLRCHKNLGRNREKRKKRC